MTICVKDRKQILWKCDFEKSYSYSFGFDRVQKMQNFLWENVWKSVRNYMEVKENILRYVKKKKKPQNQKKISFSHLFFTPMPKSIDHISKNRQCLTFLSCTVHVLQSWCTHPCWLYHQTAALQSTNSTVPNQPLSLLVQSHDENYSRRPSVT